MEEKRHFLRAGAGCAAVPITEDILPLDGFTAVRDPLHVRTVILESGIRVVIASVEITSLFPATQERMIDILVEETGAEREHVWLTLTHSFEGPHIWPSPKPGEPDHPRPGHAERTPEETERLRGLEEAYLSAVRESARKAAAGMRDAVAGAGTGYSSVNASRNILTRDGWWLGTNDAEPCDHAIHLLRLDGTDGKPIAAIFTFGVRSCVMQRARGEDGGGLISSDLCGKASQYMEEEYGDGFTALFLCSSAADQEPLLKSAYSEVTKDGRLRDVDLGNSAGVLLDAQGLLLGAQVLRTFTGIEERTDVEKICAGKTCFTYETKARNRDLGAMKPVKEMTFTAEGEETQEIYGLSVGSFNLIGVKPEIDGATAQKISALIPGEVTASAVQVNGGDKCMPGLDAYEQVKYQCQNSGCMPGSAERLMEAAASLLHEMKEKQETV